MPVELRYTSRASVSLMTLAGRGMGTADALTQRLRLLSGPAAPGQPEPPKSFDEAPAVKQRCSVKYDLIGDSSLPFHAS